MLHVHPAISLPAPPGAHHARLAPLGPADRPRMVGPVAVATRHQSAPSAPGALPMDQDVRPHPHIGLCAVSYLVDGHITHRDSLGHRCEMGPGGVGMTVAGREIVHSERLDRLRVLGGRLEMFQILLALPDGAEDNAPSFTYVPQVPTDHASGVVARRISSGLPYPGELLLVDVALDPKALWPLPDAAERAIYVWAGAVRLRTAAQTYTIGAGKVATLPAEPLVLEGVEASRLLVFGGQAVGPRFMWWNYIHSDLNQIEASKAAWREGRVTLPPGDTESFTPAPPDDGRPLVRLNAR